MTAACVLVGCASHSHGTRANGHGSDDPGGMCVADPPRSRHADACNLGTAGATTVPGPTLAATPGLTVQPASDVARCPLPAAGAALQVRYVSHQDLPDAPWTHGLSGLAWDGDGFLAVQDNGALHPGDPQGAWIVRLTADATLEHWSGTRVTALHAAPYDHLEAVARWGPPGTVVVSTDGDTTEGPAERSHVVALSPGQPAHVALTLPTAMTVPSHNAGIEALTTTPGPRPSLLVGVERPRQVDGQCEAFTRIARFAVDGTVTVYRYPLDTVGGGWDVGLTEMTALDDDTALTLERGFTPGVGSTLRIQRVTLHAPVPPATEGTVEKQRVADLASLPRAGFAVSAHSGQCAHPGLGNYEGMALGPCLSDGSRALVLVTDDNRDWDQTHGQVRRILVLSVSAAH